MAKRKKFWIDPPIQSRMLRFVVGMIAASLLVAYFSMDRGLDQSARQLQGSPVTIAWAREALVIPFYLSFVTAIIGGVVLTVIWSHRFIGPLMVLTAGIRRIRAGDLSGGEKTRDTDELVGLVEDFIAMRDALRQKVEKDRHALTRAQQRLDHLSHKVKDNDDAREDIQAIRHDLSALGSFYKLS